jgi:hypothetical protein
MSYYIDKKESESIIGLKGIEHFEKKYNAKYISDLCIQTKQGWSEQPAAIFYQPKPPVEGYSHYFAIIVRGKETYITSGDSAVQGKLIGVMADDGEIIFSRYRHDYRISNDGSADIDGGRDYVKCSKGREMIEIEIKDGQFYVQSEMIKEFKKGLENELTIKNKSKKLHKM